MSFVVCLNHPHRILDFSPGLTQILGYVPDQVHGQSIGVFSQNGESISEQWVAAINLSAQGSQTSVCIELFDSLGRCQKINLTCSPYNNQKGIMGCLVTIKSQHFASRLEENLLSTDTVFSTTAQHLLPRPVSNRGTSCSTSLSTSDSPSDDQGSEGASPQRPQRSLNCRLTSSRSPCADTKSCLTKEALLEFQARFSLRQAAAELGLSPSGLMRACRRLGVPSWGRRASANAPAVHTFAYAQKLYRKHRLVTGASTTPSPDLAAPTEADAAGPLTPPSSAGEQVDDPCNDSEVEPDLAVVVGSSGGAAAEAPAAAEAGWDEGWSGAGAPDAQLAGLGELQVWGEAEGGQDGCLAETEPCPRDLERNDSPPE